MSPSNTHRFNIPNSNNDLEEKLKKYTLNSTSFNNRQKNSS
jgi:hypothetical protein